MKRLLNVSVFGLLMFAVVAISSQSVFAQDDKTELYSKFTCCWQRETPEEVAEQSIEERQESVDRRKEAVAAGKEFVQKYGNSPDDKAITDWLKTNLPAIEQTIAADEKSIEAIKKEQAAAAASAARFNAFDKAYKEKDWNATFSAGDAILKAEPDFYDVAVVLASIGFDEASAQRDGLNEASIRYAQFAIDKLAAGVKPHSESCAGPYYTYKTKEFPECVPNALGYMNYTIGYIKHFRQKKTEEAVPYFFKATQAKSATRDIPAAYRAIGSWYIEKSREVTNKRTAVVTERNAESDLPTPDVEKIKEMDAKIDNMLAVERGYAERAIDAYSRAYSLIPVADRTKEYGAGIFATLKQLYQFRYIEKPEMQTDAQINMNVSMVKTKSMPDPGSEVQPVIETKTDAPVTTATPTSTSVKTGASRGRTVNVKTASTTINN